MTTRTHKIPTKIGKYKLVEKLAKGSMGVVYQAYDAVSECHVAIKISRLEQIKDRRQAQHFKQMFKREAQTASLLHHENILEVLDSGIIAGRQYIVMELVRDARMLKDYISPSSLLSNEQALDLIIQCARGLEYAHAKGVVHRDIKPANLLVTENKQIKIADFSIALINPEQIDSSWSAGFVGSPRYMSPEQVQEDSINPQTDLYSLAVVMYELLTGVHPFEAESFSRLIYKVINEEPQSPLEIKSDLPADLAALMQKALAKDPAKRFQTASEMIAALEPIYSATTVSKQTQIKTPLTSVVKQLSRLHFFENFDQTELASISRACQWLEFKPGDQVVEQARYDQGFYILVEGRLSQEGLQEGQSFAEAAYLSIEGAVETITASTPVTVVHISKELSHQLDSQCQLKIYQSLAQTFARRCQLSNAQKNLSDLP